MIEDAANPVLVCLRRLETKLDAAVEDLQDVKQGVNTLEIGQARLRQYIADLYSSNNSLKAELAAVTARLDRIERKLDLEAMHA